MNLHDDKIDGSFIFLISGYEPKQNLSISRLCVAKSMDSAISLVEKGADGFIFVSGVSLSQLNDAKNSINKLKSENVLQKVRKAKCSSYDDQNIYLVSGVDKRFKAISNMVLIADNVEQAISHSMSDVNFELTSATSLLQINELISLLEEVSFGSNIENVIFEELQGEK